MILHVQITYQTKPFRVKGRGRRGIEGGDGGKQRERGGGEVGEVREISRAERAEKQEYDHYGNCPSVFPGACHTFGHTQTSSLNHL